MLSREVFGLIGGISLLTRGVRGLEESSLLPSRETGLLWEMLNNAEVLGTSRLHLSFTSWIMSPAPLTEIRDLMHQTFFASLK